MVVEFHLVLRQQGLSSSVATLGWFNKTHLDLWRFNKVEGSRGERDAAVGLIHFFQSTGEQLIFRDAALLIVHDIAQRELHSIAIGDEQDARVDLGLVHSVLLDQCGPASLGLCGISAGDLNQDPLKDLTG